MEKDLTQQQIESLIKRKITVKINIATAIKIIKRIFTKNKKT
jgi:hypothetical protein